MSYRKIKFNQIHKADVILTTARDSPISMTIRASTNSEISHTMLVTSHSDVIESISSGVEERSWDLARQGVTLAIALRRRGLSSGADQDKVVAAAKGFKGRAYDILGAVGSGMYGNSRNQKLAAVGCSGSMVNFLGCQIMTSKIAENAKDENADDMFFCSELVTRAFSLAGFPIVNGKATNMTPQTVYLSNWLDYVGHLIDEPPPKPKRMKGWRSDSI